jgi:non-specific serine/threonine protein kinase
VELAEVTDAELVELAVAGALGVRAQPGEQQGAALSGWIGDRQALLVLDNCEHVLTAVRSLVGRLLRSCAGLKVLATSRQALGIPGEHVFIVPPLSTPQLGEDGDATGRSDAVELFLERATAALPDFPETPANLAAVAELCVALDGLPLALELAAARIRTLTPRAMLDRLENRYPLLSQGSVQSPDRHRSLEASVSWSYELCTPAEQRLWARLSVFAGGFDLESVEEVCTGDGIDRSEVVDVLSGLIDKSVLVRDPAAEQPWYRMLETLRQYGADRLVEAGEADAWHERHRAWFAALAHRFGSSWAGPEQPAWITRMRHNHANLQAALDAANDPALASRALATVVAAEFYWVVTGRLSEARHWIDAALAHRNVPDDDRAVALALSAYFAGVQNDLRVAELRLTEARALAARTAHRPVAQGYLDFADGIVTLFRGGVEGAVAPTTRGVATFHELGDTAAETSVRLVLGLCLSASGDLAGAAEAKAENLRVTAAIGELYMRSYTLWSLGIDALESGDPAEAARLQLEALTMKAELQDDLGIALVLEALAAVASVGGDPHRSGVLLGAAKRMWDLIGMTPLAAPYIAAQRELGERMARGAVLDRDFEAAYREGAAMSTAQAVEFAAARPAAVAAGPLAPLTRREAEVAALVGDGLTNQQIASRLVISVRTVDGHMENILRKLDFASRAQVAAWVARGGA